MPPIDPQEPSLGAWRVWLEALASDAEAAWAAALTYGELPRAVRQDWLDALDADLPTLGVPKVAVYAPLLAVEADEELRLRMVHAMGPLEGKSAWQAWRADSAQAGAPEGTMILVLVRSLYLHFVELLVCTVAPDDVLVSAVHEPLSDGRAFEAGQSVDGEPFAAGELQPVPLEDAVEALAHAVVAERRKGHTLPDVMARFSDLFTPVYPGRT
ncbi:hypothetical protein LVJ94_13165 [Pendulispora rubella]|uniref:Uncharacterized protein n=1 Tax=Pendulispora rubella TaxID=2741070 RepID=A0ABZ2LBL9_9BACT